jgi:hypothetical protein
MYRISESFEGRQRCVIGSVRLLRRHVAAVLRLVGRHQLELPANTVIIGKEQSNRTLVWSTTTKIEFDAAAVIVAD